MPTTKKLTAAQKIALALLATGDNACSTQGQRATVRALIRMGLAESIWTKEADGYSYKTTTLTDAGRAAIA